MPAMETYRSCVEPMDCDSLGHMNVARYIVACSDGVANIQSKLGLTAQDIRNGRRLSFAVVKMDSTFHSELLVGEAIYLTTEVKAVGTKSITFHHRLFRTSDDKLCFESIAKGALLNLSTRRADFVPDDVRALAQQFMAD